MATTTGLGTWTEGDNRGDTTRAQLAGVAAIEQLDR